MAFGRRGQTCTVRHDAFFERIRETTWRVLALAIVAWVGTTTLLNFVGGQFAVREALGAVERATGGLVQGPLVAGPFYFVIMGAVIFGVGRLRGSDVGWRLTAAVPALLVTLAFWAAMQPALALWVVLSGDQFRWNEAWSERGAGWFAGQLLAQLLGNALLEETVFRGFFLPQFCLKASAHFRPAAALLVVLVGSSVLFALTHIPHRLFFLRWPAEELLHDQLKPLLAGLTYGTLYLVTRNIFICVGLHSLFNQPARLLPVPFSPGVEIVWYGLVLVLLVAWPIGRRFRGRRRASIAEGKIAQAPASQGTVRGET